jgi:hypothetical protein
VTTVRKDLIIDITANNFAGKTIADTAKEAVEGMEKMSTVQRRVAAEGAQVEAEKVRQTERAKKAIEELARIQRKDMSAQSLKQANQQLADVAKVTKVIGALSLAAEGVNVALAAGRLGLALWSGDAKKAADATAAFDAGMRSLPLGFNRIYGMGSSVGEMIFGDKADAERINAQAAAITKAYADLTTAADKYREAAQQAAKRQLDLLREGEKLRSPDRAGVLDVKNETEDRIKAAREAAEKEVKAAKEVAEAQRKTMDSGKTREQLREEIESARSYLKRIELGAAVAIYTPAQVAEAKKQLEALQSELASKSTSRIVLERNLAAEVAKIEAESAKEQALIRENARLKEAAAEKEAAEKQVQMAREKARLLRDLQDQTARQIGQARAAAEQAALREQGKILEADLAQVENGYREKLRALNIEMDGRRAANPEMDGQITQAQVEREKALAQERDAALSRARNSNAEREAEFAQKRDNLLIDSQSRLIEKQKEMEGDGLAARLEANKRAYDQMREQAIAAFKGRADEESQAALRQLMRNLETQQKADAEKLILDERTAQAKGIRQGGFAATLIDNSFMDLAGRNNPMLTELKATSEYNKKQAQSLEKMVDLTEKLLNKFGASEGPQMTSGFGLGGNS